MSAARTWNPAMHQTLFVFDQPESIASWSAIDDRVMGGMSRSVLRFDPAGHAVFAGVVSADNNGGFASMRSRVSQPPVGELDALELDVRGDGRRYKLNLRTDHGFDGINYQAAFETGAGTWTRAHLPLAAFRPTHRGRPVAGAPSLHGTRIEQLGLMIADRQFGPFALAIRSIGVISAGAPAGSVTDW
ncbi:MAG: CIA30 family protein [Thauera sp.]|nr:CIA30 family protein [Thauera sp.]